MAQYKPIYSLLKGLSILEAFTISKSMLGFQELISITGMPKATMFRFIHTLTSQNYISFDSRSRKYFLAPRVMSLGFAVLSNLDLKEVALPYLQSLSGESDQNVNLGILDRTEVVYIESINKYKHDLLNINVRVGSRFNCYQSSSGKVILAFLEPDRFQSVLNDLIKDSEAVKYVGITGGKLTKMLEEVRRRGYALNDGEIVKGVRSIAAPIFDAHGHIEAAVNMPVFSDRISRKELVKRYLPQLLATAERISASRGFIKPGTEDLPKEKRRFGR